MAAKSKLTLDDLFKLRAMTALTVSPCEARAAVSIQRFDYKKNRNFSNLYITSLAGGPLRQLTRGNHVDVNPRWSPKGDAIAFMSNRDKGMSVWILPLDGGDSWRLTDRDLAVQSFNWSPDGKRIVFSARQLTERQILERDGESEKLAAMPAFRHITKLAHKLDGEGFKSGNFAHLHVASVESGTMRTLTHTDHDDNDPVYSPDGKTIAFWSNRAENPDRDIENGDIFTIPASGGRVSRITVERGPSAGPSWSPDGKQIAYLGNTAPPGKEVLHNLEVRLVEFSPKTPKPCRVLTKSVDNNCRNETSGDVISTAYMPIPPRWSADGKHLFVQVAAFGATDVIKIAVDGSGVAPALAGQHVVHAYHLLDGGNAMAAIIGDMLNPCDLHHVELGDDEFHATRLTNINDAVLSKRMLSVPTETWVKSPHGKVHTWIMLPPGANKAKKHPAVLQIHGGPHAQYGYCFMHELQLLAAAGYVVVFSNPHGSAGYGRQFRGAIYGNWGDIDYADCMAVADWMARQKYVDTKRMGVTGGSYGGYMTNWIIGHSNKFQAAVTQRSVVNLESMFGTSDYGWDLADAFGGVPWKHAVHFRDRSPLTYATKIKTPLLIIHSDQDLRCPIEQAEQLFTTLKYLDREVELVRFEGESHGLSRGGRPQNRAERLRRIVGWFDRYLRK